MRIRYGQALGGAVALVLLVALLPVACASSGNSPGSAAAVCKGGCNAFDCQASADLLTARAALVEAGNQYGADPAMKVRINQAFATWNAVDASWQAYHGACGGSIDPTALAKQISDILKNALSLKGGK